MRVLGTVVFIALLGIQPACWSAEKLELTKAEEAAFANRMVVAALAAEARGDFAARDQLLDDAAVGEHSPAAQWHRGLLNVGGKKPDWQSIDETIAAAKQDPKIAQYERLRGQLRDTADGHLGIARWCNANKLTGQAHAHMKRVLDLSPNHPAARRQLGFARVGDKWLSPTEQETLAATTTAKTNSFQKHGKTLTALVDKLQGKNLQDRATARAEILKLKDPAAVGAVELALAAWDVPTSKLLVEWMAQVDCLESSLVLTRYSLHHPEEIIREQATNELVKRPLHDFVPEVLQTLSSPLHSMVVPKFDRQGKLSGYGQAFVKETPVAKAPPPVLTPVQRVLLNQPHLHVSLQNSIVARSAMLPTAPPPEPEPETPAEQKEAEEAKLQKLDKARQNELIQELHQRVASVIARVSTLPLTSSAEEMWKWWDELNEAEMQKFNPRYRSDYATSSMWRSFSNRKDCFIAGTPVLTQTGPKPIEQIRAGDLVLNRDLDSGELRWQPVLRATNRPPAPTVNIYVEDETFRCSGGHLFWVSGTGWKKASELQGGDVLHGAKSPVRISSVASAPEVTTFNLEVADSPNYFVGRQLILTHDVTPRETNRQLVPGQSYLEQLTKTPADKKMAKR